VAPGIVNVDFADVKAVMSEGGSAIISVGASSGPDRAVKAANLAVNSPLLESSIEGAKGVLFGVSGHRDLKMNEINEVAKLISENVDQSAKIIFGAYHDRKLNKGQLKVTLIATGFNSNLNYKNNILLPDLFTQVDSFKEKDQEILLNQNNLFNKESKNEEKKTDIEEETEEMLDIPTFLRKKKRR